MIIFTKYFGFFRSLRKYPLNCSQNMSKRTSSIVLSQEDIDGCREAFLAFDKDRSGTIDVWELRQVLEAMGQGEHWEK